MRIALFSPRWDRSCAACLKYQYNNDGELVRNGRTGEPQKRTVPTPCLSCPKPPVWAKRAGHTEEQLRELAKPYDFTQRNRQAYGFYQECAATLTFPPDPIVKWYSGLIRNIELEWMRDSGEKSYKAVEFLIDLLIKVGLRR